MATSLTKHYFETLQHLNPIITPAFVIDKKVILNALEQAQWIKKQAKVEILYTLKPLTHVEVMQTMVSQGINGFSASSLFEARLAKEILGEKGSIHMTSPGLREEEIIEIGQICDYITFNSLSQYQHFHLRLPKKIRKGLRVNPMISYVEDERYDPCRKRSKLGVPIHELITLKDTSIEGISGLHFHSNCESPSFTPLLKTVEKLSRELHPLMKNLEWINLGGGYLYDEKTDYSPLFSAINLLDSEYGLKVFMEPGSAFVSRAGCLISSVVDFFTYGDNSFAVLDTTVNHMPEVFEYQMKPAVLGESKKGKYRVFLVGSSCLAGDFFGEYHFDAPLSIGSRILFLECGAYTLVKAHMFNGINLPAQYLMEPNGNLKLKKQYTYQDFLSRC